ncbi:ATP-binding cassette sub-family G member 1 [Trichonephila clavipes]|nr:ATP-binding cassette sub-family G member 1 [Trichonephila clavipes]
MGAEFLFMDDNALPQRANIADECFQSEDITLMDRPASSPDMNPIEHVWDILGRRIAARQPPPNCLPELWRALLDEWCNIPQDQIHNLCSACLSVVVFSSVSGQMNDGRPPTVDNPVCLNEWLFISDISPTFSKRELT